MRPLMTPISLCSYTGDDWPSLTYDEAKALSPETGAWYYTSKKLAEKAAWDFMEKEKPHFALATVIPSLIYGPTTHHTKSSEFNFSLAMLWRLINGETRDAIPATIAWMLADGMPTFASLTQQADSVLDCDCSPRCCPSSRLGVHRRRSRREALLGRTILCK